MPAGRFRAAGHRLVDQIAALLESIPERPVTRDESPSAVREALALDGPVPEDGADAEALLESAARLIADHSLFNGHPRFFGYITAPPAPIGIFGDFLAAALNPNVGAWVLSPAASEVERQTVRWIAELVGYPSDCGGLLVSGGVAFAALGSSAAFVLQTLSNTDARNALITTASIAFGVMSLSALLGWIKLRRRDVSTLLEASGWAFNVRIYLRRNLSLRFTRVPPLPEGSLRKPSLLPRFVSGDEGSPRTLLVLALLVGAAVVGWQYREVIVPWVRGVVGR